MSSVAFRYGGRLQKAKNKRLAVFFIEERWLLLGHQRGLCPRTLLMFHSQQSFRNEDALYAAKNDRPNIAQQFDG